MVDYKKIIKDFIKILPDEFKKMELYKFIEENENYIKTQQEFDEEFEDNFSQAEADRREMDEYFSEGDW